MVHRKLFSLSALAAMLFASIILCTLSGNAQTIKEISRFDQIYLKFDAAIDIVKLCRYRDFCDLNDPNITSNTLSIQYKCGSTGTWKTNNGQNYLSCVTNIGAIAIKDVNYAPSSGRIYRHGEVESALAKQCHGRSSCIIDRASTPEVFDEFPTHAKRMKVGYACTDIDASGAARTKGAIELTANFDYGTTISHLELSCKKAEPACRDEGEKLRSIRQAAVTGAIQTLKLMLLSGEFESVPIVPDTQKQGLIGDVYLDLDTNRRIEERISRLTHQSVIIWDKIKKFEPKIMNSWATQEHTLSIDEVKADRDLLTKLHDVYVTLAYQLVDSRKLTHKRGDDAHYQSSRDRLGTSFDPYEKLSAILADKAAIAAGADAQMCTKSVAIISAEIDPAIATATSSSQASLAVQTQCNGRAACMVQIWPGPGKLGEDPFPNVKKDLIVTYTCGPNDFKREAMASDGDNLFLECRTADWVITDILTSTSPNARLGYVPLIAIPDSTAFQNPEIDMNKSGGQNITEGIGGQNVWVFVKYERYIPGVNVPEKVLTSILVHDYVGSWNNAPPQGYTKPLSDGTLPSGALTPGTKRGCRRMGLAVTFANTRDLERKPAAQRTIVTNLALKSTRNSTGASPDGFASAGSDIHNGCRDGLALNLYSRSIDLFAAYKRKLPRVNPDGIDAMIKRDLMKKFQPVVYLEPSEKARPSSVQFYLDNMKLIDQGDGEQWLVHPEVDNDISKYENLVNPNLTFSPTEQFLFGMKDLSQAEVYSFWRDDPQDKNKAQIFYYYFYPFNVGKNLDFDGQFQKFYALTDGVVGGIGLAGAGIAVAAGGPVAAAGVLGLTAVAELGLAIANLHLNVPPYTMWDDHLADWEHVVIRLDKSAGSWAPINVFVSQHDGGDEQEWKDANKENMTHPVVYSARGSHATYFTVGSNNYKTINKLLTHLPFLKDVSKLVDITGKGDRFFTESGLRMYDYGTRIDLETGYDWPDWLRIYRWGNPGRDCVGDLKLDSTFHNKTLMANMNQCILSDGPTGPLFKDFMIHGTYEARKTPG